MHSEGSLWISESRPFVEVNSWAREPATHTSTHAAPPTTTMEGAKQSREPAKGNGGATEERSGADEQQTTVQQAARTPITPPEGSLAKQKHGNAYKRNT